MLDLDDRRLLVELQSFGVRGISQELKDNIFWRNFENVYDGRG